MDMQDELLEYQIEQAIEKAETIEEYRKIIRIALGKWLNNLQSGEIRLTTVGDLKVLIEADMMLKEVEE